MDNKKKVTLNNVKSRFLFIPPSVEAGLEPEAKIDDFKITKELGEGSFGRVLQVTHRATGKIYAIKAIDKRNKQNQQGKPYFRREIEIMYKVHHPNAVRLYTHFEDDTYCYFVMELVSKGNLFELMQKRKGTLDQSTIIHYMRDLISAVYYLHNMEPSIIHRDIKPENVLITENNTVKLTDFGWSNYIDEDGGQTRSTYCGTPLYLAPEMIKEIGHDEYLDIWCLGVLMFELITGNLPFTGKNVENLSGNILKNKIVWPNDIGPDEKDLLSKILKTNPQDRLTLKQILAHPYFTKIKCHDNFVFYTPKEAAKEGDNDIFLISTGISSTNSKSPNKLNSQKNIPETSKKNSDINLSQFTTKDDVKSQHIKNESGNSSNLDLDSIKKDLHMTKLKSDKHESTIKDLEKKFVDEKKKTQELTQVNQDLVTKLQVAEKNKNSLISDLEEKESAKINFLRQISELNEKIFDKDNKNKNLTKAYKAMEEKNNYNDEEIKRLDKLVEENDLKTEKLKSEHQEQINQLQKKLLEAIEKNEDNINTRCTLIRDSLNEMTTMNPVTKYSFGSRDEDEELKKKIESEYEGKINKLQTQFTEQIKMLQNEIATERNKFNTMLKERENDIKKLLEERKSIKETITKSFEKSLTKSDLTLKIKDSEIEKLNSQIKKYEKILEMNGLLKKK